MFDLDTYAAELRQTTAFLRTELTPYPELCIVAGTGLGSLAADVDIAARLPYEDIPNFPVSTVQSHQGELIAGTLGGRRVAVFNGRFHLYEGYAPHEVVFPFRALFAGGCRGMIVTNAAGGLDLDFQAGDVMLIEDHINFMGANALVGPHDDAWGPRFPDMSRAYDRELRELAVSLACELGISLRRGTYVAVRGPNLETPAETRMFRLTGADAIGMSTVQEVIAAVQAGVRVVGLSAITNVNNPDDMQETSLDDVIAAADLASDAMTRLITALTRAWPA